MLRFRMLRRSRKLFLPLLRLHSLCILQGGGGGGGAEDFRGYLKFLEQKKGDMKIV